MQTTYKVANAPPPNQPPILDAYQQYQREELTRIQRSLSRRGQERLIRFAIALQEDEIYRRQREIRCADETLSRWGES